MKRALWLISFCLAGCAVSPREAPRRHDLADLSPLAQANFPLAEVRVTAAPWLASEVIAYRLLAVAPTQRAHYAGHRWSAPPDRLVERFLARRLVLGRGCRLWLDLDEFEQRFDGERESRWVTEVRARLLPPRGGEPLVASRLHLTAPAGADAESGIHAARDTLGQLVERLGEWLAPYGGSCNP